MNLAAAAKMIVIGLLALVLLVPVLMIESLVSERQARRNEVVTGIAEGWGKRQSVAGPYLAIPYERHWTVVKRESVDGKLRESRTEHSESRVLRVPAASVEWTVGAEIGEKARGIYKARLYNARLQAQGSIDVPARSRFEDGTSRYKWGTPRLVLGISDPLGIRAASGTYPFAPGSGDTAIAGGLHAPLADLQFSEISRSRSSSAARRPSPSPRWARIPRSRCAPTGRTLRSRGVFSLPSTRSGRRASRRAGKSRA